MSWYLFVWAAAQLVRLGLLRSLLPLVRPLHAISQWVEPLVSDKGAMFVTLQGTGLDGLPLTLTWQLLAAQNHGPHIPCGASIALANRLASASSGGAPLPRGAMPCVGLLTVENYLAALQDHDVTEVPA